MKHGNKLETYPVQQWRRLAMPPRAWGVDIWRLLQVCGRELVLRVAIDDKGQQVIEVFCSTEGEHAQAEMLLHQAAADEVLRSDINAESSKEIGMLVDSVLKRANGG